MKNFLELILFFRQFNIILFLYSIYGFVNLHFKAGILGMCDLDKLKK